MTFGNDPLSWSSPEPTNLFGDYRSSWVALSEEEMNEGPPLASQDPVFVDQALQKLREVAPAALAGEQPFFLAVGTKLPHYPQRFPERFLDMYPEEDISEPDNGFAPYNMPDIAWFDYALVNGITNYKDVAALEIPDLGSVNVTLPAQKVPI